MTDYQKAAERLRLALPLMAQKKVSATPINYAVFFEYVSKTNELLNDELDKLMSKHEVISDEFCQQLYDKKMMAFELETLRKMQQGLRKIVDALLLTIKQADKGAEQYVAALDNVSRDLTVDVQPEQLLSMVNRLSEETSIVRNVQAHIRGDIEGNQEEVERLKQELEKARQEATTDALTGLLNRKAMDEILREKVLGQGKDRQEDLCLLILDIDKFKSINDNYGHLVGDKVIRYVASVIQGNVNADAKAARFGGEEFLVLLPDASLTTAMNIAENIRKAQERGHLVTTSANEAIGKVTISIGVTNYLSGESLEKFIDRADKALYQAKTKGRNRVVLSPRELKGVETADAG